MNKVFCAVVLCACAYGQDTTAVLEGQITDASGSAISGATVQAVSEKNGYTRTQITTSAGTYHLSLPSGVYDLRIDAASFARHVRNGIELNVSQTARLDFRLQVTREKEVGFHCEVQAGQHYVRAE